jgi:hypothetical protein
MMTLHAFYACHACWEQRSGCEATIVQGMPFRPTARLRAYPVDCHFCGRLTAEAYRYELMIEELI